MLLTLAGLAILTAYLFYRLQPHYRAEVFSTASGWGYDILNNGKPVIHQPTVPGQPGTVGFTSEEQAQRVGDRVVEKLQKGHELPTMTHDELRQLGVKIP